MARGSRANFRERMHATLVAHACLAVGLTANQVRISLVKRESGGGVGQICRIGPPVDRLWSKDTILTPCRSSPARVIGRNFGLELTLSLRPGALDVDEDSRDLCVCQILSEGRHVALVSLHDGPDPAFSDLKKHAV